MLFQDQDAISPQETHQRRPSTSVAVACGLTSAHTEKQVTWGPLCLSIILSLSAHTDVWKPPARPPQGLKAALEAMAEDHLTSTSPLCGISPFWSTCKQTVEII